MLVWSGCAGKKAPPSAPWLTDARVQGQQADWARLYPRDTGLPPTTTAERGRSAALETSWAARLEMEHDFPAWWEQAPFARRFYPLPSLDREVLEADRLRIRDWFVQQGWIEAAVALTIEPDPTWWGEHAERKQPGSAWRAVFVVVPGRRWSVSRVAMQGAEPLPSTLRQQLDAQLPTPRPHYTGSNRADAEDGLWHTLASHGYPRPYVTSVLIPDDPTGPRDRRTATLLFHVDAGTAATFGPLEFQGLEVLDRGRLHRAIRPRFAPGDPWDVRQVEALAYQLDRLPAFATVRVKPGQPTISGDVPVQVKVSEADAGGWAPVVGVSSEASLFSVELGGRWRGNHIGRGLASAAVWGQAGYRAMPVFFGPERFFGNHGPVGHGGVEGEFFIRPLAGLSIFAATDASLDTWRGYHEANFAARAGLRWRPLRHLTMSMSPEIAWWQSFATPSQQPLYDKWFVEDSETLPEMSGMQRPRFRSQTLAVSPRLDVSYVHLDDPSDPHAGAVVLGSLVPWGMASGDPWSRASIEAHGFIPTLAERLVIAPRMSAGWMAWHGADAAQAMPTRFFAGGGRTVRGWSTRMLNPPGWDGTINDVRIGGNVLLTATMEARFRIWPQLHVISFVDTGRVWEQLQERRGPDGELLVAGVSLQDLQTSAGAGVQIPSPIGTVVTSVAVRLNKYTGLALPVAPFNVHFSLTEHF